MNTPDNIVDTFSQTNVNAISRRKFIGSSLSGVIFGLSGCTQLGSESEEDESESDSSTDTPEPDLYEEAAVSDLVPDDISEWTEQDYELLEDRGHAKRWRSTDGSLDISISVQVYDEISNAETEFERSKDLYTVEQTLEFADQSYIGRNSQEFISVLFQHLNARATVIIYTTDDSETDLATTIAQNTYQLWDSE